MRRRRSLYRRPCSWCWQQLTALPVLGAADFTPLRLPLRSWKQPGYDRRGGRHEIQIGVDTGGARADSLSKRSPRPGAVEPPRQADWVWTDSSGQSQRGAPIPRTSTVRVGDRTFTNVDAIEAHEIPNGPAVAECARPRFLKQFIVIIDYPGSLMTLLSPRHARR